MAWTIDLRNLGDTTTHAAATPFRTAQFTWAADGTGAFEIDLTKAQGQSGLWLAGRRRVILNSGATRKFAGWLERLGRAGPPLGEQYKAAGRGLSSILAYRAVHGDFNQVAAIRTVAAEALIAHMVAQTDDKTNFSNGTVTGLSNSVNRFYTDGDIILDSINELAQTQSGGFAWEIDENGKFNAWVGGRGTDRTATYTLHDSDTTEWTLTQDYSEAAPYITGLGNANNADQPCGPNVTIDTDSTLAATCGRREVVVLTDTNNSAEMSGLTTEEQRARTAATIALTTVWIEGRGPWAFGSVWIGDTVTGALGTEFGGNQPIRCTSIQLNLEQGKHEFVQMTWEAA